MALDQQLILLGGGIVLGGAITLAWSVILIGVWRTRHRRPRMTRFQREIVESRMTADDELEYDRIIRALGGPGREWTPPQTDWLALYDEVERRYLAKEISLDQYKAEISELGRTYGPTYIGGRHGDLAG